MRTKSSGMSCEKTRRRTGRERLRPMIGQGLSERRSQSIVAQWTLIADSRRATQSGGRRGSILHGQPGPLLTANQQIWRPISLTATPTSACLSVALIWLALQPSSDELLTKKNARTFYG